MLNYVAEQIDAAPDKGLLECRTMMEWADLVRLFWSGHHFAGT